MANWSAKYLHSSRSSSFSSRSLRPLLRASTWRHFRPQAPDQILSVFQGELPWDVWKSLYYVRNANLYIGGPPLVLFNVRLCASTRIESAESSGRGWSSAPCRRKDQSACRIHPILLPGCGRVGFWLLFSRVLALSALSCWEKLGKKRTLICAVTETGMETIDHFVEQCCRYFLAMLVQEIDLNRPCSKRESFHAWISALAVISD